MKDFHGVQHICLILIFILFLTSLAFIPNTQAIEPEDKEVQETITMWLMYKMKKELDISNDTCIKLVEKIEQSEALRRNFFKMEHDTLFKFDEMLKNNETDQSEYKKLVEALDKKQKEMRTADIELQKALNDNLNPIQRAKLMLIMNDLRERIRRIIRSLENRKERRRMRKFDRPMD